LAALQDYKSGAEALRVSATRAIMLASQQKHKHTQGLTTTALLCGAGGAARAATVLHRPQPRSELESSCHSWPCLLSL